MKSEKELRQRFREVCHNILDGGYVNSVTSEWRYPRDYQGEQLHCSFYLLAWILDFQRHTDESLLSFVKRAMNDEN